MNDQRFSMWMRTAIGYVIEYSQLWSHREPMPELNREFPFTDDTQRSAERGLTHWEYVAENGKQYMVICDVPECAGLIL